MDPAFRTRGSRAKAWRAVRRRAGGALLYAALAIMFASLLWWEAERSNPGRGGNDVRAAVIVLCMVAAGCVVFGLWIALRAFKIIRGAELLQDESGLHFRPLPVLAWVGRCRPRDLEWREVRFQDGKDGHLVIVSDVGRLIVPDVYEVGLEELSGEIARRAGIEAAASFRWRGYWTDAPHVRKLIDGQLARYPEAERTVLDGGRRVGLAPALEGVWNIVFGVWFGWLGFLQIGYGSRGGGSLLVLGLLSIAGGGTRVLFARSPRIHRFWLVTPEFIMGGGEHVVILSAASAVSVRLVQDGLRTYIRLRLRDGSSAQLWENRLAEPIRRLVLKPMSGLPPPRG